MCIDRIPIVILMMVVSLANVSHGQEYFSYSTIFNLMDANDKISYFSFGFNPKSLVEDRVVPLTDREGSGGYQTEGNLRFNFPLIQKRVHNDVRDRFNIPVLGHSRIRFNYHGNVRATTSKSGPIVPPTNSFGLSLSNILYFKNGRSSKVNILFLNKGFERKPTVILNGKRFHFLAFEYLLNHYSNGQPPNALLDSELRNNYSSGNFSTNHHKISLNWGMVFETPKIFKNDNYVNIGLFGQKEFGPTDGTLTFEEDQIGRYGKKRIGFSFLYRSGSLFGFNIRLRNESEYILDKDMSKFPYQDNLYRFSNDFYFDIGHRIAPALGLVIHRFTGRDYLNIRYDDPVGIIQFGISLEFSRFTPNRKDIEILPNWNDYSDYRIDIILPVESAMRLEWLLVIQLNKYMSWDQDRHFSIEEGWSELWTQWERRWIGVNMSYHPITKLLQKLDRCNVACKISLIDILRSYKGI